LTPHYVDNNLTKPIHQCEVLAEQRQKHGTDLQPCWTKATSHTLPWRHVAISVQHVIKHIAQWLHQWL